MAISQRIEYIVTDDHDEVESVTVSRADDEDGNDIVTISQPGNEVSMTAAMASQLESVLSKIMNG